MKSAFPHIAILFLFSIGSYFLCAQPVDDTNAFLTDSILDKMERVNDHFLSQKWQRVDRNWIRGTYYTGLMEFYKVTEDPELLKQASTWASKHGWKTGTEWIYPANRMTCVQTYLELYFIDPDLNKINNAQEVMDDKLEVIESAEEEGWDYVDALYVGTPAYVMMTKATNNPAYSNYGYKVFRSLYNDLYDQDLHLFYRDLKAKKERSENGNVVLWSRGNGWAMASIPRILKYLPADDINRFFYIALLQQMSEALALCQGSDGFWRVNLADSLEFPMPESSGTAFFTYAMAWGINNGMLNEKEYFPIVQKSWNALYNNVNNDGKVLWGQGVARGPEEVHKEDSHEYVSGAFLLAGSEMLKLLNKK